MQKPTLGSRLAASEAIAAFAELIAHTESRLAAVVGYRQINRPD